jgi:hypothetical protein
LGLLEELGLIAFDLKEIVAALFDNEPGVVALTMQWIGGNHFAIQRGQLFQQSAIVAQLAALVSFFLIIDGDGLRSAILVLSQGKQADVVPDHLAIQSQGGWQTARAIQEPLAQQRGERFGVHAGEHLIKNAVPRDLI